MISVFRQPRWVAAISQYHVGASFLFPTLGMAQSSELEALRDMVKGMQQDFKKALSRIEQLEKEKTVDSLQSWAKSKNRFRRCKARRRFSIRQLVSCSMPRPSIEQRQAAISISEPPNWGFRRRWIPLLVCTLFHRIQRWF